MIIPPAEAVEQDTPCRRCGYNLRGLPLGGRCPECGIAVGVSVHGDLLRYSDPQFVLGLGRGVSLILWGILAIIIGSFIVSVLQALQVRGTAALARLLPLGGYGMTVVGAWLLTMPDPSGLGEERYGTARKLIRATLVIGIINYLVSFIHEVAGPANPRVDTVLSAISLLTAVVSMIGEVAQLYYLSRLAMRIPEGSLSQRARFLMWSIPVSYGAVLLIALIMFGVRVSMGRGASSAIAPFMATVGCFAVIATIALLVFAVMYLFLLGRLGRQFRKQAALAQQTWSAAASPPQA